MIKLENTEVVGFEAAIRGMRNPKNSWDKSDSHKGISGDKWALDPGYVVGEKDEELMRKLVAAGKDHRKFLRMIVVYVDITAPTYWWAEMDTYKVGTVRNSCSFMHTGMSKEFTVDDFSTHGWGDDFFEYERAWGMIVDMLNELRDVYLKTKDEEVFQSIRCLLPSGYMQRATMELNYEVLSNIYHARLHHRLDEWRELCKWIESLPYSWLITW